MPAGIDRIEPGAAVHHPIAQVVDVLASEEPLRQPIQLLLLERLGTPGVLAFIVASMLIVVLTIGLFGPRTRNRALEDIAR